MKSLLIISPHFPPVNAADMHRVRQGLSFFPQFNYTPIVMAVEPAFVETGKDDLLLKTLPKHIEIQYVKAFSSKWTRKIGLGALALRSLWFYFFKGNQLLKNKKFDLIYFSTTQFPVLILGRYWKWRFKVPYVIDMQDPWHSDFYKNKPKNERPPKYWFSYNLNKYLEPIAMKGVAGIISVSEGYCAMLQQRYKNITPENCTVIPFGAFEKDFEIANNLANNSPFSILHSPFTNIVYVGRGGKDMEKALTIIFTAFKKGLAEKPELFEKVRFHFIGTSYAPGNKGVKTIEPVANAMGVEMYINEQPARIPYFETLKLLQAVDLLLIPGSEDPNYTASKLYPYILAKKPILAVFSFTSSVIEILAKTRAGEFITFDPFNQEPQYQKEADLLFEKWSSILEQLPFTPDTNWNAFKPYTAREMTKKQADFFNKVLSKV